MKIEIKKELVLTLNHAEIVDLREQLRQLPHLWLCGEIKDCYINTPIGELWYALNR